MIEIKRLIAQLRSAAQLEAYYNSEYNGLYNQAADVLEELQAKLELAKAERDVAVEDLHKLCPAWKWDGQKED